MVLSSDEIEELFCARIYDEGCNVFASDVIEKPSCENTDDSELIILSLDRIADDADSWADKKLEACEVSVCALVIGAEC